MPSKPPSQSTRTRTALGLCLLAVAVYANAGVNGFALDDGYLIAENPRITSLRNVPDFFVTDLFDGGYPAAMYYRPLVLTSFALEHAVAGSGPFLYHVINILLHAGVSALAYLLAVRLFASQTLALVCGAIFAVHPVHTEAVTAISGRGDLLASLFLILAGLLYAEIGVRRSRRRTLGVILCFTLALFSKESAIVSLALFPLVDLTGSATRVQQLRVLLRERAIVWLGLGLSSAVFLLVRHAVTMSDVAVTHLGFMGNRYAVAESLSVKLATCAKLLGIYYQLLVFPLHLSADYDYNQIPLASGLLEAASLVPVLLTLALVAVAVASYRANPPLLFGIAFLLSGLLPIAFGLPFFQIPLAERYLYLPSLGLCIIVGALVAKTPQRVRGILLGAMVVLVILPGAARTVVRNRDWRDDETLFAATVETAPNSSKAQANRAATLAIRAERERVVGNSELSRRLFQQATLHFERSVAIEPQAGQVRMQYAHCLAALGEYVHAEAELSAAIELGSGEALVHLYRLLIEQTQLHAPSSPALARKFHRRASELFDARIRPAVPVEQARQLESELRAPLHPGG